MVNPPPTKYMEGMYFMNALDALIPKIPFSFFCQNLGPGHLRGPGVSLSRISRVPSIGPFWGGSSQGALSTPPPPPQVKARLPQCCPRTHVQRSIAPIIKWHVQHFVSCLLCI